MQYASLPHHVTITYFTLSRSAETFITVLMSLDYHDFVTHLFCDMF